MSTLANSSVDRATADPAAPLRIGLTGGIASGKSAVSEAFAALGIQIIDADLISRELVEPGQPALAQLVELFGPAILDERGRLDRARMRERVFADATQRRQLEAVLHPAIHEVMRRRATQTSGLYQILVIPLLVENRLQGLVDHVVVVDATPAQQLQRLQSRDGISAEQAQRILDAQADRHERLDVADDVIRNTGSLAELDEQVAALHRKFVGRRI